MNIKSISKESIFLLLLVMSFFSSSNVNSQTFSLSGRLLDADTKEYLDGASVTFRGTAFGDISNNGGLFNFERLLEDRYVLSVRKQGYNTYEQVVRLKEDLDLGDIFLVKFGAEGTGAAIQKTIRANNITSLFNERPNMLGGNMIYGIPPEPKKLQGNSYLDKKWNSASILLYQNEELMEGFRVRYNVISNMFELLEPETSSVSTVMGLRIQNIVWVDSTYKVPRYFVNGMDFKDEGSPISGFFEVLVDGEMPLMRRTMVILKESNYNQALMVGNRDDQLVKRNYYYYLEEKNVIRIPSKKKKFYALFGEQAAEMEEFASSNSLNHRDPSAIFQIFTHFNSQFSGFQPIISQLIDEQN